MKLTGSNQAVVRSFNSLFGRMQKNISKVNYPVQVRTICLLPIYARNQLDALHGFREQSVDLPNSTSGIYPRLLSGESESGKDKKDIFFKALKAGSVEEVEQLLHEGVSPDEKDENGNLPLVIAAVNDNLPMIVLLLKHGAKTFPVGEEDPITYSVSKLSDSEPSSNKALAFLSYFNFYFHQMNVQTAGVTPGAGVFMKKLLIDSVLEHVGPRDFKDSLDLELALRSKDKTLSEKYTILHSAIENLDSYNFIWLSTGFISHAVDIVISRNEDGGWKVNIGNLGPGFQFYHHRGEYGRIYPKDYDAAEDTAEFKEILTECICKCFEGEIHSQTKDEVEFYQILSPIGQLVGVVENRPGAGNPWVAQLVDNCKRTSLVVGLDIIFSLPQFPTEPELFDEVMNTFETHLTEKLMELEPSLTEEDLREIIDKAKENNRPLLTPAETFLKLASDDSFPINEREEMLNKAKTLFHNFLNLTEERKSEYYYPITDVEMRRAAEGLAACERLMPSIERK